MAKKNILLFRIFCIAAILLLFCSKGQTEQVEPDILASLSKDEVFIELFRSEDTTIDIKQSKIEKADIIKKEIGCAGKLRRGVKTVIKDEKERGSFAIDGVVTEKTPKYVIFDGKIEFVSKDKKHRREIAVTSLKLIKGETHILGGIKESSGETEIILMKAIW